MRNLTIRKVPKFWPPPLILTPLLFPSDFSEMKNMGDSLCFHEIVHTQKLFNYFSYKTWKEQFFSLSSSKISKSFWNQMFGRLYNFLFMQCMSVPNKFDKKRYFFHEVCWLLRFIDKLAFMPIYWRINYSPEILVTN